jgi:xanthine dehydrogenase accessory factor
VQRIPGPAAAAVPFGAPLGETIYMTEHIHDHDALDDACAVAHGADTLDASCEVAHGTEPAPMVSSVPGERILVAVFASPVSGFLLRYAADLGYRGFLVEPDEGRAAGAAALGFPMLSVPPEDLGDSADVIVTDHHREELGLVLRDMLATKARWIGVLGNRWHVGPHIEMLSELGVPPEDIARVHRPIGLNIGSKTPAEIAISVLAGLVAERNDRPGGFEFDPAKTTAAATA